MNLLHRLNQLSCPICQLNFASWIIVSPKSGYGSRTVIFRIRRDFLVFNLQATFLFGFLLNFASGLLWQRSGHPFVFVGQESKLGSGESKNVKNFDYCLCSSISMFHINFKDKSSQMTDCPKFYIM